MTAIVALWDLLATASCVTPACYDVALTALFWRYPQGDAKCSNPADTFCVHIWVCIQKEILPVALSNCQSRSSFKLKFNGSEHLRVLIVHLTESQSGILLSLINDTLHALTLAWHAESVWEEAHEAWSWMFLCVHMVCLNGLEGNLTVYV